MANARVAYWSRRRALRAVLRHPGVLVPLLIAFLFAVGAGAAMVGAAGLSPDRIAAALASAISGFTGDAGGMGTGVAERDRMILMSIRLPRIVLAAMVGALLAFAGALMQGMFRNPLADPGLVGVSGGAALAAALSIVFGDVTAIHAAMPSGFVLPFQGITLAAFVGALLTTLALFQLARQGGQTSIATFLLGGLAVAALTNAAIGLLVYAADDQQLRDITFWMLGSLGGATWAKVAAVAPFLVIVVLVAPFIARSLDLFALGEREAFHSGVDVERLKRIIIVLVAAATGAAVSVSGIIGFVGIVVPHLLRITVGPGHRLLLPAALLLGGALLILADAFARVAVAPAELPIGVVTAAIGAPFFLVVLLRQRAWVGA